MNTVSVEEPFKTVGVQFTQREVLNDPIYREVSVDDVFRSVDVTMTYTLEEFYIISPFHIYEELEEGALWSLESSSMTPKQP